MFNKLKDLHELKKQAGAMQAALADERVEVENNGVKIVMNGNNEVLEIKINPELDKEGQEKHLKETINQGIKKVQQLMAQKMVNGGFGF